MHESAHRTPLSTGFDGGARLWRRQRRTVGWALGVLAVGVWGGTGYSYGPAMSPGPAVVEADVRPPRPETRRRLESRVRALAPRGAYIVIDRGENRLYLRTRDEIRLDAVVSTGSGTILRETSGERRTWIFDTPAGRRAVLDKRTNPVWVKPDWAFLEEGEAIPGSWRERLEPGVLGEYALDLGDAYLIHGTLYERLLGRSVTHGCIRVGRDDLRALVRASGVGTPVFIF